MERSAGSGSLGYRIIGAFKLASALMLGSAGFGIFRLINKDLGDLLEHFFIRHHPDPENQVVHSVMGRLSGIDRDHLKAIGAGTLFYALLESVEGVSLTL